MATILGRRRTVAVLAWLATAALSACLDTDDETEHSSRPALVDSQHSSPDWIAEDVGQYVSTAGDVNGDSYSDVIISGDGSYVYHGSSTGLSDGDTPDWTTDPNVQRYTAASTAGDVNGDGYSDVIFGWESWGGEPYEGRAWVHYGSHSGLSTAPNWSVAPAGEHDANFGSSVSTAGDVNGDGYSDVIIGAGGVGRAYVYHGSSSGL